MPEEEFCLDCEEYRKEIDALNERIKELEEAIQDGSQSLSNAIDEIKTGQYVIDKGSVERRGGCFLAPARVNMR